ncbi:hypothetical protein SRB17_57530 [Streptomyces sp. RB17]|uniref:hypothetical protein n=1 Tax=Streptomyces sp. RB17 TaxID=2585197 RepID=UPI0012959D78|nr:hypothetical protein [Streptomyces sp. RB17]MQY37749.1 hypothetical protein [Streptomyces sp. RB17]
MTGTDGRETDLRDELDATLQTRRELGEEYESALVDSFLEKVDQRIDGAVERRLRRTLAEQRTQVARGTRPGYGADSWAERFGLAVVSLVLAIPLSAIGAHNAGLSGLLISWAGVVGVNVVQAARTRPDLFGRRRRPSEDD